MFLLFWINGRQSKAKKIRPNKNALIANTVFLTHHWALGIHHSATHPHAMQQARGCTAGLLKMIVERNGFSSLKPPAPAGENQHTAQSHQSQGSWFGDDAEHGDRVGASEVIAKINALLN